MMRKRRESGVAVKENATVRRENLAKRKVEENARLEKDDKQRDDLFLKSNKIFIWFYNLVVNIDEYSRYTI